MYRGPNGNKCAAGHLIPDDKYIKDMDRLIEFEDGCWQATYLAYEEPICSILKSEGFDSDFVTDLQRIHDLHWHNWESWKQTMINFAIRNNLSTEVFNTK